MSDNSYGYHKLLSTYLHPGNSNGCDLIYEDYCYQTFTVSVGANWNDAQSTCAVWGGDLTSIPTRRVNDFIQTVLPDTTNEYWIGLYEEDVSLKWIDGSELSFTITPTRTGSCVAMNTDGNWFRNDCDILLNNFLCRRNSSYIPGISVMLMSVNDIFLPNLVRF